MSRTAYDYPLIPSRLLTNEYYLQQLTMMLRQSYGIPEQIDLFVRTLNVLNKRILDLYNLTYVEDDYEGGHINIDAINELSTTQSDLLDKLAEIVGCSRYYSFLETPLNNNELYVLIKFRILQNNFKGTYEEIKAIYEACFDDSVEFPDFSIDYYTDTTNPLTCMIVLDLSNIIDDEGNILDEYKNLYALYMHDMLEVKSLGVRYTKMAVKAQNIGFFDKYPVSIVEDTGEVTYDTNTDHCGFDTAVYS